MANEPSLIKTYGLRWKRAQVNWKTGHLFGISKLDSNLYDVYHEHGIIILYKGDTPVYAGMTMDSIGKRLKAQDNSRRKKDEWDHFSWFGIRGIHSDGLCEIQDTFHSSYANLLNTLYALLLASMDFTLNKRKAAFKDAICLVQTSAYLNKNSN